MMKTNLHEHVDRSWTVLNVNKNFSTNVLKQGIASGKERKGNI